MPKVTFLPHETMCPEGAVLEAQVGDNLINLALAHGIDIEHACEKSCACTTCHVVVRKGFASLPESDELEDDLLDRAWGLEAESRLSCQTHIGESDIVIEIPRYTINQVSERH